MQYIPSLLLDAAWTLWSAPSACKAANCAAKAPANTQTRVRACNNPATPVNSTVITCQELAANKVVVNDGIKHEVETITNCEPMCNIGMDFYKLQRVDMRAKLHLPIMLGKDHLAS